jgi:hypothetical protein
VILPKQATPWYQFGVLAVWTYLHTRENQYRLGTPARKNLALDGAFRWTMCRFWEVSFFKKLKLIFFCDTVFTAKLVIFYRMMVI